MRSTMAAKFQETARLLDHLAAEQTGMIAQAGEAIVSTLKQGGKVLLMGNGGSAADAQHIAGELVSVFYVKRMRQALPAIALTTNSSVLTAIANDFGYDRIFVRQVEALMRPGDVVIGISTSGNSPNVLEALRYAKQYGGTTIALIGSGGKLAEVASMCIRVPSADTPRVQECHIAIGHALCDMVDDAFVGL